MQFAPPPKLVSTSAIDKNEENSKLESKSFKKQSLFDDDDDLIVPRNKNDFVENSIANDKKSLPSNEIEENLAKKDSTIDTEEKDKVLKF